MIVETAARIILAEALRGATWAGQNVIAAPIDPLPPLREWNGPRIVVLTTASGGKSEGRDLTPAERHLQVTLQIFAPSRAYAVNEDLTLRMDHGGTVAMMLDIVGRQVVEALQAGLGTWPSLWRRLVVRYDEYEVTQQFFDLEPGVKVAGKEITLFCRAIPEPALGAPASPFWSDLLAAMEDDEDLAPIAPVLRGAIEGPEGLPSWHQTLALMGWSLTALQASGLGPVDPTALTDGTEPAEGDEDGGTIDPAELSVSTPFGEPGALDPEPAP